MDLHDNSQRALDAKNNPSSWRELVKEENEDEFCWEDKNASRIPFSNLETKNRKKC